MLRSLPPGPVPPQAEAILAPLLERAALTQAINEAWAMIALLTLAVLLCVPVARARSGRARHAAESAAKTFSHPAPPVTVRMRLPSAS
ncbi:hypothetical protein C8J29_102554 [Cereibacter johrii]|uniref:Uncharacterized protein n=1 Tax=Cereibacter johrii TaxID=445629 RepID=A0ABX5JEL6_9RHOB|nr:hypothetical protein C8J29_102554 [Cereibacter johrii]